MWEPPEETVRKQQAKWLSVIEQEVEKLKIRRKGVLEFSVHCQASYSEVLVFVFIVIE